MAFDGLFICRLLLEIKKKVSGQKILNAKFIDKHTLVFELYSDSLYFNLLAGRSHFYLGEKLKTEKTSHWLDASLEKYVNRSIITSIKQIGYDRTILITVLKASVLGYDEERKLYFEFMGRDTNFIITDKDDLILDALNKSTLDSARIIKKNIHYTPFKKQGALDPFAAPLLETNNYEGVSKNLYSEIYNRKSLAFLKTEPTNPTLFLKENDFYWFKYKTIFQTETKSFSSLCELVRAFYQTKNPKNFVNNDEKEIKKLNKKILLLKEKIKSEKLLKEEKTRLKLISYWHGINKTGENGLKVTDENNETFYIKIDPNINIRAYINNEYKKIKKYEDESIKIKKEILFLSEKIKTLDLKKKEEKFNSGKVLKRKISTPFGVFTFGTNRQENIDAKIKNGYFFHLENAPSSHVYFNGTLSKTAITVGAAILLLLSKSFHKQSIIITSTKNTERIKGFSPSLLKIKKYKTYTFNYTEAQVKDILKRENVLESLLKILKL